jgi:YD repeat-containing protein
VVTTNNYDTLNRVTAATITSGATDGTVTYEYDNTTTGGSYAKGKLTKITDPSGTTSYVYDALGRVTSKAQVTNATPANKTFTVGYSYSSGHQTGITYPSGRAIAYTFDAKGQIASVTVDGTDHPQLRRLLPWIAEELTWATPRWRVRSTSTGRIDNVTVMIRERRPLAGLRHATINA